MQNQEFYDSCVIALRDFMGVQPEETLLIITDEYLKSIGETLHQAGKTLAKESLLVEMKAREINGEEPPKAIADLMKAVDVVVCPTKRSLTHTNARREAAALGVRVGTMPGVSVETIVRCFSADFERILNLTDKVKKTIEGTKIVKITTALGTDLEMNIEGRAVLPSSGVLRKKGESGNLPSGEVYLAPLEGTTNGRLIIDGSLAGVGIVKTPIEVIIKDGYAESINGGEEAERFKANLDKVGRDARAIAEFGVGTNYKAQLIGEILEDEKALGTIHIAFGNNVSMGGNVSVASHIDGLVNKPTVYLDGKIFMKDGEIL